MLLHATELDHCRTCLPCKANVIILTLPSVIPLASSWTLLQTSISSWYWSDGLFTSEFRENLNKCNLQSNVEAQDKPCFENGIQNFEYVWTNTAYWPLPAKSMCTVYQFFMPNQNHIIYNQCFKKKLQSKQIFVRRGSTNPAATAVSFIFHHWQSITSLKNIHFIQHSYTFSQYISLKQLGHWQESP